MTRAPAQPEPHRGHHLLPALDWHELWPSTRAGLWVVALFAVALLLARLWAEPIRVALAEHHRLGIVIFVVTSAVAVVVPALTNLPLLPLAVLAWGPWWAALLLQLGWVIGAGLSFVLARRAREPIMRRFPSVMRHAQIDRLIHPTRRLASLVLLRMTFPVDVLSYALGLFSPRTTLAEVMASTAIGAAPFALVFAWFPALPLAEQAALFVASALAFVVYALWMVRRARRA